MNQERKSLIAAFWRAWWLPLCGGAAGLTIGLLILLAGFWQTVLVLVLMVSGVVGGWLLRRRLAREESGNGMFSKRRDDDLSNF